KAAAPLVLREPQDERKWALRQSVGSLLDCLIGEHAVVHALAAEHVLPFRDVRLAADHGLDDAEVLDGLRAADDHSADDAVAFEEQFAVNVRGGVVEDDWLRGGGGGGMAHRERD